MRSVLGLGFKLYEENLKSLDFYQLEYRQLRCDLLMTDSILNILAYPPKCLLKVSPNTHLRSRSQKSTVKYRELNTSYI